jgi:hypothetical protein
MCAFYLGAASVMFRAYEFDAIRTLASDPERTQRNVTERYPECSTALDYLIGTDCSRPISCRSETVFRSLFSAVIADRHRLHEILEQVREKPRAKRGALEGRHQLDIDYETKIARWQYMETLVT